VAGPLEFHTHLWPGYETLTREERESLRAILEALPGGRATLDIAWAACDGRRTLGEIARLVEIETGLTVPAAAVGGGPATATWHDVFGWMERLGLASRAPETAARWTLEPSDPGSTS
jgi:hypothetical protein